MTTNMLTKDKCLEFHKICALIMQKKEQSAALKDILITQPKVAIAKPFYPIHTLAACAFTLFISLAIRLL